MKQGMMVWNGKPNCGMQSMTGHCGKWAWTGSPGDVWHWSWPDELHVTLIIRSLSSNASYTNPCWLSKGKCVRRPLLSKATSLQFFWNAAHHLPAPILGSVAFLGKCKVGHPCTWWRLDREWIVCCFGPFLMRKHHSGGMPAVFNIILPSTLMLLAFEHVSVLGKERKGGGGRTYKHLSGDLKWTCNEICILQGWWVWKRRQAWSVQLVKQASSTFSLPWFSLSTGQPGPAAKKSHCFRLISFLADKHVKIDVSVTFTISREAAK